MIRITVTLCLMGVVMTLPVGPQQAAQVVRNDREVFADGSYRFAYELSDGQARNEVGQIKEDGLVVTGSFTYVGPDGVAYTVDYVADKDGFKPQGEHIPQAFASPTPPIMVIEPIGPFEQVIPPPVALPPSAINSLLG